MYPLTADWSSNAACKFTYQYTGRSTGTSLWLGYSVPSDANCYPPNYNRADGTFSPGRCPTSWTTASTYTTYGSITGALCCSSGYEIVADSTWACRKYVPTPTTALYISSSITTETTVTSATAIVRVIEVVWQNTDLAVLGGSITPNTYSFHSTVLSLTVLSTPSSLPTAVGSPRPEEKKTLSTGALLGIALPLAIVFICAIVLFFWLRKRRRAKTDLVEQSNTAELPDSSSKYSHTPKPIELGIESEEKKHELDGSAPIKREDGLEQPTHGQPNKQSDSTKLLTENSVHELHSEKTSNICSTGQQVTRQTALPLGSVDQPALTDSQANKVAAREEEHRPRFDTNPEEVELRRLEEEEARIWTRNV